MERAAKIQYLLKVKGTKQQDIANSLGVDKSTVSQVINGKRRSERIARALAKATGIRYEALFPEVAA